MGFVVTYVLAASNTNKIEDTMTYTQVVQSRNCFIWRVSTFQLSLGSLDIIGQHM